MSGHARCGAACSALHGGASTSLFDRSMVGLVNAEQKVRICYPGTTSIAPPRKHKSWYYLLRKYTSLITYYSINRLRELDMIMVMVMRMKPSKSNEVHWNTSECITKHTTSSTVKVTFGRAWPWHPLGCIKPPLDVDRTDTACYDFDNIAVPARSSILLHTTLYAPHEHCI